MSGTTDVPAALRAWAKGVYPIEAGVELLVRGFDGRFAEPGNPWIQHEDAAGRWWVNFPLIVDRIGVLSGGERRYLLIAASLGAPNHSVHVDLGDVVGGMDRELTSLVLAAISHAAGTHDHRTGRVPVGVAGGSFQFMDVTAGALYPWPE
jgi:hypothetical protein